MVDHEQRALTISEVAVDWQEPVVVQRKCSHPLPALTDIGPAVAASKHTTAPINHTRPSPHKRSPDVTTSIKAVLCCRLHLQRQKNQMKKCRVQTCRDCDILLSVTYVCYTDFANVELWSVLHLDWVISILQQWMLTSVLCCKNKLMFKPAACFIYSDKRTITEAQIRIFQVLSCWT